MRVPSLTHVKALGEKNPRSDQICLSASVSGDAVYSFSTEHHPAARAPFNCEKGIHASVQISEHFTKPFTGISVILFDLVKNQSKQLHP